MMKPSISDVVSLFEIEFTSLLRKFKIFTKTIQDVRTSQDEYIYRPGCYVFWTPDFGVIKVGRSLSNSRKRALQHIQDNTGGEMRELEGNSEAQLILFNVNRVEDLHWVAAAEVFLEQRLKPRIQSQRLG